MKHRTRRYYSPSEREEIWDRWQRGESMSSIGRQFERESSSIYPILQATGGIRPPTRKRSTLALSIAERESISRSLALEQSMRSIAKQLGRSPSTISREIERNGGAKQYRAVEADEAAWQRAHRPKLCKLAVQPKLRLNVARKLKLNWSPVQIGGWLKREYPKDENNNVSHETIYKTLYIQARGALKKELQAHLRASRSIRRSKHATMKRTGLGSIKNAVSISKRPPSVEARAIPGHWEGDLIGGSKNSYIATLVERQTRYVLLVKVKNKDTNSVISALIKQTAKLPRELYKSLTWDRGKEMAGHKRLKLETDLDVYFCDPKSPWQRGLNENTNRLLRQYFPKGTDLSLHSQSHLNKVARQLNERPRKTLDFETPAERFEQCVASIG